MMVDLLSQYPDGLTLPQLIDFIYSTGRAHSRRSLWVAKFYANKQLAPQGWKIVSGYGQGAKYRLVKLEGK